MSIVGPVAQLLRPVPTHGVCLSVRVCTRARVVTFVLSFFSVVENSSASGRRLGCQMTSPWATSSVSTVHRISCW